MPHTNPPTPYVDRLILAGSASIHTWRYLQGISPYVGEILLVGGGNIPALYRPHNLRAQLQIDFRFSNALYALPKIRTWLHDQQCFALKAYEQSRGGQQQAYSSTVLHIHSAGRPAWYMFLATKNMNIPTVLTCYGSDILVNQHVGWKRILVKRFLQKANYLTVPSYDIARVVQTLCPSIQKSTKKLSVLNFGVDEPPTTILVKKEKRVLSNRLHKPLYRIDAILRAWQTIESVDDEWCLTVAGDAIETPKLKALSSELGLKHVEFVGFVDAKKLATLYASSLIYVSVPASDAVSISLFEAMIQGCIPVVSNISGNCETIIDGINGVVHAQSDLSNLPDSLLRAMRLASDIKWKDQCTSLNQHIVRTKGLHSTSMEAFAQIYHEVSSCRAKSG